MFHNLAREPEIKDERTPRRSDHRGRYPLRNVSFAYEPDREILKGSSFEVPACCKVAGLVFRRRKSTISRPACPRLRGQRRRCLSTGAPGLRDVTQKSLRAAIGHGARQDTVLFTTPPYNIPNGRWEAGDA